MKINIALLFLTAFFNTTIALAWESHPDTPDRDINGDLRFNSEHVRLTSKALIDSSSFEFLLDSEGLKPPLEVCREVKDFNSASLKWKTLTVREYCPANFAELPDFFHNMEDYINQGNACPPLADWDTNECHSFEHFMGALNSSHFPPQTKGNYQRYHDIAQAIIKHSNNLHDQLSLAEALPAYRDHWEECKMEALTYESIGQHYLQDQWAMGHMWHRWGGPDVDDFSLTGSFAILNGIPRAKISYGLFVGGISGFIHGWKSAVPAILNTPTITNDSMSFYRPGVEWVRPDFPGGILAGNGDLFIDQEGEFDTQKMEMYSCTEEGFRQLRSFQKNFTTISDLCWQNFATNEAMYIGLNYSPSTFATLAIIRGTSFFGIDGVGDELSRLSLIYKRAFKDHRFDTYIAEGYATPSRNENERITLFSIKPNDAYKEVSSYIDPARTAPGDPADTSGVQPDNDLFGVRQVKYFNKCHANLYCENTAIVNQHRNACKTNGNPFKEVDCQICEELAGRFYLGEPPLCKILAPGFNPDPSNQNPPGTSLEVSDWCREKADQGDGGQGGGEPAEFPQMFTGAGTMTRELEVDYGFANGLENDVHFISCDSPVNWEVTLNENGTARLTAQIKVRAQPDGESAFCQTVSGVGDIRIGTGTWNKDGVAIDVIYEGTEAPLTLNISSNNMQGSYSTPSIKRRVAGFGNIDHTRSERGTVSLVKE